MNKTKSSILNYYIKYIIFIIFYILKASLIKYIITKVQRLLLLYT